MKTNLLFYPLLLACCALPIAFAAADNVTDRGRLP